jgi:hypothetical protein
MEKKVIDKGIVEGYTRADVRWSTSGEGDAKTTTATITVGGRNYSVTEYNCFHKRTIKSFLIAELEKLAGVEIKVK